MAGKLKEADPHAAEILSRLRVAIGKTTDPDQLSALAQAYAAVAKRARPATAPVQDIAVLLEEIRCLRGANQSQAFVAAILAALRLGSPPLTWDQAGLVVTARLLWSRKRDTSSTDSPASRRSLAAEWRRCRRHGIALSLVLIDVDYFKAYNDHYSTRGASSLQRSMLTACG